ncbi:16S rRNA (adenine(1518)-N(6)/adenine(1519)-N(6))-dimethyltransferase [Candidatus Falkowbacteria bacterium]|nr:16S rRNA (adenine(1518)-N(6)/adenine(1519)-N(6))-dimethyltransferase [Candidatus Falkowbacteria bacterium]
MKRGSNNFLPKDNFRPRKRLGQNFLIDKNILRKIMAAARLSAADNVLEVGPGKGILTEELVKKAKRVVAVEKDKRLAEEILNKSQIPNYELRPSRLAPPEAGLAPQDDKCVFSVTLSPFDGVYPERSRRAQGKLCRRDDLRIICADILKITADDLREWFNAEPYKIVANLPYNITSRFLRQFLESDYQPKEMILMVQKEVAERVVQKPGQMSLLSVSVQFFCEPEILFFVSKNCFQPAPKVDSAVIRLNNIRRDKFAIPADIFFAVVKKGFSAKRKQLKNNLGVTATALSQLGLKPTVRPQELSMGDWIKLAERGGRL